MANTSELNSTLEATQRVPAATASSTTTAASNSIKAGGGHHRDSRVDSGSVDLETPLELSPKSPLEVLDETLTSVMRTASSASPIPPPRSRNNQMAAQAAAATSNTTQWVKIFSSKKSAIFLDFFKIRFNFLGLSSSLQIMLFQYFLLFLGPCVPPMVVLRLGM